MGIRRIDMETNMREAFKRALPMRNHNRIQSAVAKKLHTNAGIQSVSEWNARLSFATAQDLLKQGVLVH